MEDQVLSQNRTAAGCIDGLKGRNKMRKSGQTLLRSQKVWAATWALRQLTGQLHSAKPELAKCRLAQASSLHPGHIMHDFAAVAYLGMIICLPAQGCTLCFLCFDAALLQAGQYGRTRCSLGYDEPIEKSQCFYSAFVLYFALL